MQQDQEGKPQTVPVITLLVTPEDAAKLAMASTQGKIQLALRNTVDTGTATPEPVLQSVLFSSGAPAVVAPVKHVRWPRRAAGPVGVSGGSDHREQTGNEELHRAVGRTGELDVRIFCNA